MAGNTFAVIETGGKQYRVFEGDVITIERLPGEHKEGSKFVFDKVLLVDNGKDTQIGDPYLEGAQVHAVLEVEEKGKKTEVLRYKAKSRYLKRKGHRQVNMVVRVAAIK